MSSEPYIVEIAVLLLLALVLGGLAGFWARRWFMPHKVAGDGTEQPQVLTATAAVPVVEEPVQPAGQMQSVEPQTANADKPILLDKARNDAADDLKKIKGIGPKIEKTLNDLGVFHYDQIAAWDQAAIAWVDEKLSFRGRIARENWVSQAKALAAEKN